MTRFWLAIAIAGALLGAPARAETALERRIDDYVQPIAATRSFAGVVLVARGDQVLAERAYGLASPELGVPHRADDTFQLASVSKPITAAAVLKLAEQGRIDLRAPISTILPDYPNGQAITVHQLLNHTSGIPNVNEMPIYRELGLKRRTPGEIVDAFKAAKPNFAPGASLAYSNSNYALLALIIEKASGRSYGDFLRQEIFAPLGMTASGHRGDDAAVIPRMSQGYAGVGRSDLARPPWFDWTVKTGNGSLYANARDLHRFANGYFSGRVIGPALLKTATTGAPDLPAPAPGSEWMPREVGYGWLIDSHLGRRRLYHAGSSPGFSTALVYYPDDRVTVVVLSNVYIGAAVPIAEAAAALAFGRDPGPTVRADAPLPPAEVARLVGAYRFGPTFGLAPGAPARVYEEGGRLWLAIGPADRPGTPLLPIGPLAFMARDNWTRIGFEAPSNAGPASALVLNFGQLKFRAERAPGAEAAPTASGR